MDTKTLWLEALRALGPTVGNSETWLQNTLQMLQKKVFHTATEQETEQQHRISLKTGKTETKCTHPYNKHTYIHLHPSVSTHSLCVVYFLSLAISTQSFHSASSCPERRSHYVLSLSLIRGLGLRPQSRLNSKPEVQYHPSTPQWKQEGQGEDDEPPTAVFTMENLM